MGRAKRTQVSLRRTDKTSVTNEPRLQMHAIHLLLSALLISTAERYDILHPFTRQFVSLDFPTLLPFPCRFRRLRRR